MNKHIEAHEDIIKSLTEALFILMKTKTFSEITITELIKKAGVARSTYYRNFESKEDIIALFFDSIFQEFQATYPVVSIEERYTEEHITHVLEFLIKYTDKVNILNKAGISSYYLKHLNKYLISLYSKPYMSQLGCFLIYAIAGAEYNLIFNWFLNEKNGSKEELIKEYVSLKEIFISTMPQ